MSLATKVKTVELTTGDLQATRDHEKVHLDTRIAIRTRLETIATGLDAEIQMVPLAKRKAVADWAANILNTRGQEWFIKRLKVESIRQDLHLDHLGEQMRDANVALNKVIQLDTQGKKRTYGDKLRFELDTRQKAIAYGKQLNPAVATPDQAKDEINNLANGYDTDIDTLYNAMKAEIQKLQ